MSVLHTNGHTAWAVNPYSWRAAQALADSLGLPLVAAMVLAGRGVTDVAAARTFLDCSYPIPDPFLFADMEGAVTALSAAVDQRRRVVIHGDYDADGITATALMLLGLRDLGIEAEWYLPNRFNEGYGLSRNAVESIAAAGPALLITVDCGVNYPDEVALAKSLGLDVIVVDHHQPGPVMPDCHLIHHVVGDYPHGDLCGVGLALKLMHGLDIFRGTAEHGALPARLERLLDLVAIGTIADLAPLRGENRRYVKEGLKLVGIGQRVGIRALSVVAGCSGVVDSGTVAYRLAPRLNAAGRLADPSPPLRLLLTEDEQEARSLAAMLHELNGARQDVERQILDQAIVEVEKLGELPSALVLAGSQWHEGVVGIVASRLVERYHRPTILLSIRDGVAKGSGRSISGYDLMDGLGAGAGFLTVYGGHKQAVGLTLPATEIDGFRCAMLDHATACLREADLVPAYQADVVLRGEDVNADTALALAALGPFGTGNPRPRVLLVDAALRNAEATRNGAHLRCSVEVDGVRARAIGFGLGASAADLNEQPEGRVLGTQFRVDEWQGSLRPEFLLECVGVPADGVAGETHAPGECVSRCPLSVWTSVVREPTLPGATTAPGTETAVPTGAGSRVGLDSLLSMPGVRDLRGARGRTSSIAQVVASGERTAMLACSIAHTLPGLRARVPLPTLCGEPACFGRACTEDRGARPAESPVVTVEWEALHGWLAGAAWSAHVIALDPPFRASHISALEQAATSGALVHLCYGDEQREETARLLRYLLHPRFAMVCVYRALQEGESAAGSVAACAAQIAWREAGVVLTAADVARAAGILEAIGVGQAPSLEAKLYLHAIPAYAAAEADYEECSKLCLIL